MPGGVLGTLIGDRSLRVTPAGISKQHSLAVVTISENAMAH